MVVDPSLLEENVQEGQMTIACNAHGELCTVSKAGGVAISLEQLTKCASIANVKVSEVAEMLKRVVRNENTKS